MQYPHPATSKHILAMGIAYHLSDTASSNLHERILEYLAMEYPIDSAVITKLPFISVPQ
jgi:hypothetical protein